MPSNSTHTLSPPADLAPGESYYWDLRSIRGGPADKKGYYAQFAPFDGVLIDSYTGVRLTVRADGMESPVPGNTARTLDSNSISFVEVAVPDSASATVDKEDLQVVLYNDTTVRETDDSGPSFSGKQLVSDLVPGVSL